MTLGSGSASLRKILGRDYCVAVRVFMRRLLEQSGLQVVRWQSSQGLEIAVAQDGEFALVITDQPTPFIALGSPEGDPSLVES